MTPQNLFVATVTVCLMNGLASPMVPIVRLMFPVWLPEMLPATPEVTFYGASLIVSTFTLLLAAIPAAFAERTMRWSEPGTMMVWLVSSFLAAILIGVLGLMIIATLSGAASAG